MLPLRRKHPLSKNHRMFPCWRCFRLTAASARPLCSHAGQNTFLARRTRDADGNHAPRIVAVLLWRARPAFRSSKDIQAARAEYRYAVADNQRRIPRIAARCVREAAIPGGDCPIRVRSQPRDRRFAHRGRGNCSPVTAMSPIILVPMIPDMKSLLSAGAIESASPARRRNLRQACRDLLCFEPVRTVSPVASGCARSTAETSRRSPAALRTSACISGQRGPCRGHDGTGLRTGFAGNGRFQPPLRVAQSRRSSCKCVHQRPALERSILAQVFCF